MAISDDASTLREGVLWKLVDELYADPAVSPSTMMGFPCLRLNGKFFASFERGTSRLIVKLPADRVDALVHEGTGQPFAPNGRVFREWVAFPEANLGEWRTLMAEAKAFAMTP